MSMTPEQAEKSAHYEAKLRGVDAYYNKGFLDTGLGGWWYVGGNPALDPYNPADMWELVKLAKLRIRYVEVEGRPGLPIAWQAVPGYSARWPKQHHASPLEAAQAAWFNA